MWPAADFGNTPPLAAILPGTADQIVAAAEPTNPLSEQLGDAFATVLRGMVGNQVRDSILALLACTEGELDAHLAFLGLPAPRVARWRRGPAATRWSIEDARRLTVLWIEGVKVPVIADEVGRKVSGVYRRAKSMGLPRRRRADLLDTVPEHLSAQVAVRGETPAEGLVGSAEVQLWDEPAPQIDLVAEAPASVVSEAPAAVAPEPKRRDRLPVKLDPSLVRYTAPADDAEARAYLLAIKPNLLVSIRARMKRAADKRGIRLVSDERSTAVEDIYTNVVMWFLSCREGSDQPRWREYNPDAKPTRPRRESQEYAVGKVGFHHFILKQVEFKVGDWWERRQRDDERRHAEVPIEIGNQDDSGDTFERLLQADANDFGTSNLQVEEARGVEDRLTFDVFIETVNRISDYFADKTGDRASMGAPLRMIVDGFANSRSIDQLVVDIGEKFPHLKTTRHSVREQMRRFHDATEVFRLHGVRQMCRLYGVPA